MDACKFRLSLTISILVCSNAFGQIKKPLDLNQSVAIVGNSVRLDSLLKNITRQTGFIFSYNTRKVNHGLKFTFANKNYSVKELLMKIKEKTGLDYSLADNHIILKSARLMASPMQVQAVPATLKQIKKTDKTPTLTNSPPIGVSDSSKTIEPKKQSEQPTEITGNVFKPPVEKITPEVKEEPKNITENTQPKIQPTTVNQPVLDKN